MNVANVDYGSLHRLPELAPLSVLEEMLLSPLRLYHVVVKVCALFGVLSSASPPASLRCVDCMGVCRAIASASRTQLSSVSIAPMPSAPLFSSC